MVPTSKTGRRIKLGKLLRNTKKAKKIAIELITFTVMARCGIIKGKIMYGKFNKNGNILKMAI